MKIIVSTVPEDRAAFIGRLRQVCEAKAVSASQIADDLGISYESVRKWFNGQTQPNKQRLADLARLFDVSVSWLQFGETGAELSHDKLRIRHIPLINLTGMEPMGVSVLSAVPVSDTALCFDMRGDSMEPLIHEGWRCVVDRNEPIKSGDVVLYNQDGHGLCRTLIQEGGRWLLKPENRQYDIVPADLSRVEGPVVFTGYRPQR